MNAKTLTMALFSLVMFAATPWVLAATIPLPDHRPGNISPEVFNFMRHTLASIKQFDLGKLGIPVEKSLRLAGGASKTSHSMAFMLDAISPKKMEPMLAWYRKRLPGWKLSEHYAGRLGTLISPKDDGVKISIMPCIGGTYQIFPCGSHVRFYNPNGKQGSPAAKRVHILSGQENPHGPAMPEHSEHNTQSKRKINR